MDQDLAALTGPSGMGKKGSFIQAVKKLDGIVKEKYSSSGEKDKEAMFNACKRAASLLKSRYTAVGFWRAGKDLFVTATEVMSEPNRSSAAKEWLASADTCLLEKSTADADAGDDPNKQQETPARSNPLHASREEPLPQRLMRDLGFADFLNSITSEADIEQLLSMVSVGGQVESMSGGQPSASREARFNLDMKTIKEHGIVCLICQESFPPKTKAKVMPCGHPFHYDCLMEWLERHNTCPTCRYELATERPTFDLESDRVAARDPTRTTMVYS